MENPSQWKKIKEVFDAALAREPGQRDAFLRDACGSDDSLRAEVESLLVAHANSDGLSAHPWTNELLDKPENDSLQPITIGPYRLIRKLGEGGMGQVWLAEQTEPIHRQVALKLIRGGVFGKGLSQRFQAERQSLAIMDHPAIAKVFDAGTTPDGQPYFVMEYVPGEPITTYCDRKKLPIQARVELFIQACEGVQHAHQKAIIHRDLKPANILIVEHDGKPTPRIIDFGLAKAAAPPDAAAENLLVITQAGGFVGTPGYMSPEQADPSIADIDTRTDVYSLGVILYELLTGQLPFDASKWKKQPLHEMLHHLRENDPPRPSAKVESDKRTSSASADRRCTEPSHLANLLHGDLDWITMKALEKDRARRYGTPSDLAADLDRYLQNEPVLARPASVSYRTRKYLRRHRVAAGAAVGLVLLLASFAAVQAVQLRRITRERDRANRITNFMTSMFKVADPSEARGNTITAREILDRASKDIDPGLAKDPQLQAQMMYVMGRVYESLGLYPRAQELLERSADIRLHTLGPEDPETLRSQSESGRVLELQGHLAEAEKTERQTLAAQRRVLGADSDDAADTANDLGWTLQQEGRYAEAEALFRRTLEIRRRTIGPDNPETVRTLSNLAWTLSQEGHRADVEALNRQALEVRQRILGPEHPDTIMSMNNLAGVLIYEGRYAEAETLFRQTLDARRRVLGAEHPETISTMNNLAVTLKREGHYADAEAVYRETLDIDHRVLGPEHPRTLLTMSNLAETLAEMHRYAEAENLLRQALEIQRRVLPPGDPSTAISMYNLAGIEARQGRRDAAFALLRDSIDHGLPPIAILSMDQDPDLAALRPDSRFAAIVAYAKQRSSATAAANASVSAPPHK